MPCLTFFEFDEVQAFVNQSDVEYSGLAQHCFVTDFVFGLSMQETPS